MTAPRRRPNIFQGVVTGANAVSFLVPFQNPGSGGNVRLLRIENLRVNAALLNNPSLISGTVTINGNPDLTFAQNQVTIGGVLQPALSVQIRNATDTGSFSSSAAGSCGANTGCNISTIRFQEDFASAFKVRSQGVQNVFSTLPNSESGFFDPAWSTTNPTIAGAGLADFGTRVKADFTGIPAGAQVFVATTPTNSSSTTAALTASETGPFQQVSSSTTLRSGSFNIPAAQLTVTNGAANAVWEVTAADPFAVDTLDFPVWVVLPSQTNSSTSLSIQGSLAPNASDGAFNLGSAGSPQGSAFSIPRFVASPQGSNSATLNIPATPVPATLALALAASALIFGIKFVRRRQRVRSIRA